MNRAMMQRIVTTFNRLDEGDISTERLIGYTADRCHVDYADVVEALALNAKEQLKAEPGQARPGQAKRRQ